MAEELETYEQVGPGDPDPLGLDKKLAQLKSKADPLGLEAKLRAAKAPVQQQPAFELSEPTLRATPKESIIAPSSPNEQINIQRNEIGYIPDEKTYKIQQQQGKAKIAHEKVSAALTSNDAQYEKKLRESRRDNFTVEALRDQYKQNGQILSPQDEQKLLQKEKDRLYNLPVTKDELTDFKTGTILTPKLSRKFIKDLNDKDVAADAHAVDKFNEIANDPDPNAYNRIEKINEVTKGIRKGTYVYDPETKTTVQPLGMVGSIMEGVKNKFKADEEHDFLKNTTNDAAIISQLEDERNNPDRDEPIKVPRGKVGEVLKSVAEMPMLPMVAGVAGTIGGTFVGNPELGTVAATALGAYENRKAQYRATFKQVYNEARDQGKPEFDALTEARRQAENAQEIGTVVGAAQGYLGGKIGEIPVKGASFNLGYQNAIGDFLKKNGSDLGKIVLDAAAQGGLGAAGEITKNKLAQAAGIKRDWDEGTESAFWGNALMTAGIGAAIKLGRGISKVNYKTILSGLTKAVPEEAINSALQEKVSTGEITQAAADQALNEINEYKAKDAQIPANVTEDARFKIQDNIDKINELQAQKEATHESLQGPIKEKIQKLIDDNLALAKETVKEEKPVSGLSKSQEKEAIDFAHELVDEGLLPDTYSADVKKDPIGFLKTIAQQAQNRDENWKSLSNPLDEQAVRDNYGDTVVDYAKELFPAPEIYEPSKSISVIQPGEVKQPEAIADNDNIKVGDLIDKEGSYKGQKGAFYQDGQTVVFKVKGSNREYEIGNIDEVKNSPIRDFGIEHETSIVDINDNGDITVRGNAYKNNYSDPLMAINKDKDGNVVSVNLETSDGKKRTFRGNIAEDIAYNISLKEINKNNETRTAFEDFINSDEPTKKQIENAGLSETSKERANENIAKIQRVKIESEPITIKPKENAIPIGSSEEIHVGETPGDSQPVGEGVPKSGETPGTQEPIIPKEEGNAEGQEKVSEPEMIGITHAEMDKVSKELGLPEYTQDPETFEGWIREAKDRIAKDPNAINKLINKLRKGEAPDPVETQMMKMHFAALKDRYNSNPTPELLAEINRTKDLYNISGRQLGKGLVARRGLVSEEDTLADFHMRDVEFNKGAPLTEEQTVQSTKEFQEIKAAKDALEEKVAKLEADKAKIKAQKELDKISKETKKGTSKDYKAEREKVLADIKKKWDESKGQLSATFVPYADRLFKIAPDALRLVKLLVEEGVDKLPELVKAAHDHLKNFIPEITEKDVHDIIAGEYNAKKPSRNQLQEKVYDIKLQAKLINKLEALQSGVQPKSPKQKRVRSQEIEALKQQIKDLEGSQGRTDAEKLASLKGRYKNKIAEIEVKIKNGDFGPDDKPEPIELDKEGQELKDRYIEAKKERELRLAKQEYEDRPFGERAWDTAMGVLDLRRMIGTAFDFSVPFRQALPVTINPLKAKTTALAFKKMFSHFWSARNLDRWWFDLENSADYKNMLEDGVPIHSPDDLRISKREEEFRTKLAEKIPIIGAGVKMSNRAASGYLNSMRVDLYRKGAKLLSDRGITRKNSPEVYKALGNDIANLTGSGKLLEALEGKPAKALGNVFFGARLMAAKFNLLNPITYAKMPKPIMRRALRDLAIRTGMYITAGYLAKAAGLSVSLDPNDKDFMKIKHGETSYDITGGEAIYIRTFLRVLGAAHERISGEEKSSLKTAEKAGSSVTSFFRNKLAPTPAYAIDAFIGKKATGEKFDPYDIARVYPMWIDDIVDDWHQDKAGSILTAAIPSIFGIGVMTIPPKEGGSGGGAGATGKYTKTTKQNKQGKLHKTHR